jgi:hypothetical protein
MPVSALLIVVCTRAALMCVQVQHLIGPNQRRISISIELTVDGRILALERKREHAAVVADEQHVIKHAIYARTLRTIYPAGKDADYCCLLK